MRKVISLWIEPSDKPTRDKVMRIGLREVSRRTRISPSMMTRWLRGLTGMNEVKVERVNKVIETEAKNKETK